MEEKEEFYKEKYYLYLKDMDYNKICKHINI